MTYPVETSGLKFYWFPYNAQNFDNKYDQQLATDTFAIYKIHIWFISDLYVQ